MFVKEENPDVDKGLSGGVRVLTRAVDTPRVVAEAVRTWNVVLLLDSDEVDGKMLESVAKELVGERCDPMPADPLVPTDKWVSVVYVAVEVDSPGMWTALVVAGAKDPEVQELLTNVEEETDPVEPTEEWTAGAGVVWERSAVRAMEGGTEKERMAVMAVLGVGWL